MLTDVMSVYGLTGTCQASEQNLSKIQHSIASANQEYISCSGCTNMQVPFVTGMSQIACLLPNCTMFMSITLGALFLDLSHGRQVLGRKHEPVRPQPYTPTVKVLAMYGDITRCIAAKVAMKVTTHVHTWYPSLEEWVNQLDMHSSVRPVL